MYGQKMRKDFNQFQQNIIKNENQPIADNIHKINELININNNIPELLKKKSLIKDQLAVYKKAKDDFDRYSTINDQLDCPYNELDNIAKNMYITTKNQHAWPYKMPMKKAQQSLFATAKINNKFPDEWDDDCEKRKKRWDEFYFEKYIPYIKKHAHNLDNIFKALLYKNVLILPQNTNEYSKIKEYKLQSNITNTEAYNNENDQKKTLSEKDIFFGAPQLDKDCKITNTNTQLQYVEGELFSEDISEYESTMYLHTPLYHYTHLINRMQNAIRYLTQNRIDHPEFRERIVEHRDNDDMYEKDGDIVNLEKKQRILDEYENSDEQDLNKIKSNLELEKKKLVAKQQNQQKQNESYINGQKSMFFPWLSSWFGFGKK